ncbi:DUF3575 domain-containing protein [Hymenobacter gelipurpurascens]|nr:DUF3575 domain-containing protein [Hymenobacter gelipurpurascens]
MLTFFLMRRLLFFLVLLAVSFRVSAQSVTPRLMPTERLLLKLAPLTLFDPNTSALLLGVEFRPVPRVGLELDYGFRFTPLRVFNWNIKKENMRYQKFKAEGRFYFPRTEQKQWYIAAEGFYVPEEYDLRNSNFYRNGEFRAYEQAHIEKTIEGGALKAGMMRRLGQRFWLDAALGLGFRRIETVYTTQNERAGDYLYDAPEQNFLSKTPDPGVKKTVHPALALRVAYSILK